MKPIHCLLLCVSFALIACSGSGGSKAIYHPDVGPFDENGDYVEALADAPVRKNSFSRSRKPKEAKASKPASKARRSKTQRVAKVTPPSPPASAAVARATPTPVQATTPRRVLIAQSPQQPTSRPVVAPVRQPAVAPKPTPKPKAVVVTPKKKAPVRHVVRKSDTLYGLSRKYGVSVGAIQRANSLRGTTIITGKSLLIPR